MRRPPVVLLDGRKVWSGFTEGGDIVIDGGEYGLGVYDRETLKLIRVEPRPNDQSTSLGPGGS